MSDLATEDTIHAVVLAEEIALLASTPKYTRAATPISVRNFTYRDVLLSVTSGIRPLWVVQHYQITLAPLKNLS